MKKILFAVQLPPPVHGSSLVNKFLVDNARVNQKYNIDVLEIQLANDMEDMGHFSVKKIVNALFIFFRLINKLFLNKYDLVYFTLTPTGFAFYKDAILVLILKIFNRKIVFHMHGKGIKKELNSKFKKKIYSFVFLNAEIVHLAKILYDDVKDVHNGKVYYLANGIVGHKMKRQDFSSKKTSFLYLSNLMKEKGILVFMNSIKKLQKISKKFDVCIVGPSSDVTVEYLKSFVVQNKLNNVKVIGPAYGEDKINYFNQSDVFVLPTFNDCFPLTILEAFQSGLAVISTDNGAITNIVEDGINGYIIKENNFMELADRMEHLIKNKETLKKMKSINRLKFKNNYTEEIFIENFINIIDQIIENN